MKPSRLSVEQAISWATEQLKAAEQSKVAEQHCLSSQPSQQQQSAAVDARYLLSHVIEKSFTWLKTWPETKLTQQQWQTLQSFVERRTTGEPIAYITGVKDFWTLTLKTNPSTLIPRAETELLIEQTLARLDSSAALTLLDLGTGTGAIALSLAKEFANSQVYGCDFQEGAVDLAIENARLNQLENVHIFQSDWFSKVPKLSFDAIVANPPYVEPGDPHLQQGDLVFEPDSALVAEENGLADIRNIADKARSFLNANAPLLLEHGYNQGAQVRSILQQYGYSKINTIADLDNNDRVTLGFK